MNSFNKELENIKYRYEKRKRKKLKESFYFIYYMKCERERKYYEILKNKFSSFENLKIMEIGAGSGDNLLAFKRFGFKWENIYANELLDDRVKILKENLLTNNIYPGNALDLHFKNFFDIVLQSTVFTSILDIKFKRELAKKLLMMTKENGLILWYDFKVDNPYNKDVKGISKEEIKKLFKDAKKIRFHSVTLAPPLGRRVGKFYNFFNFIFPFLRTHLIAEIHK
jgi:hypothetical protein